MARKPLAWELAGVVFIVLLGSFMHFTFELSGNNPIVGSVSAVNESTWEHLKLSVFPALLFALIESRFVANKNFLPAKALGTSLMPVSIVALFYGYHVFMPGSLFIDILIFVIAVIIGQAASCLAMASERDLGRYSRLSLAILILLPVAFMVFTFYPPYLFLFQDPITGGYGIIAG